MDIFEQLRKSFDGADSFVSGGHSVRGGGSTSHSQRLSKTPEWANSDAEVRSLILKIFPKINTSQSQRQRASNWALIIYFYYRMGLTQNRIAMKIGWTPNRVKMMIRNINRAVAGKTTDTGAIRGRRKGRPKKTDTLPATSDATF